MRVVGALVGVAAVVAGGPAARADEGSTSAEERAAPSVPRLGLTDSRRLGLPPIDWQEEHPELYPPPRGGRFDDWYAWQRRAPLSYYYHGWYPWFAIPRSERVKLAERGRYPDPVYPTPRLGLQYLYPEGSPLGLQLPVDPELEVSAAQPLHPLYADPVVAVALEHFREGRAVEAGRLLTDEIRADRAHLATYLVISEVLLAKGQFPAAAKVLRHAVAGAPDLAVLEGVDIAGHFPSPEVFSGRMGELEQRIAEAEADGDRQPSLRFLAASFGLLSGDPDAMPALEALDDAEAVAEPARRLYFFFLDRLLGQPESAPAADDAAPPEASGGGNRSGETDRREGSGSEGEIRL